MTHPRDHTLSLSAQLRSDMTDLTKVSVKVRVNGGAATTYTSTSTPAVAQAQDCAFAYHVEIPASTYADGDRVSRTWIYNGVPYAYGDTVIGPAEADGANVVAIKGKTDLLGAAPIATTTPVSSTGAVQIVAGDDYKIADGRALAWVGAWPSLTGATIALEATIGLVDYSFAGAAAASGTDWLVQVEIDHTVTAALTPGRFAYTLTATLTSGRIITLATGPLTIS